MATFSEPHLVPAADSTTLTIREYHPRLLFPQGGWLKSPFWRGVSPRWLHVGHFGHCLCNLLLIIIKADPKLKGQA